MLVYLLTHGYLQEEYLQTAYNCVVYVVSGKLAPRIAFLSRERVTGSTRPKLEFTFIKPPTKKKATKKASGAASKSTIPKKRPFSESAKGKERELSDEDGDEEDLYVSDPEVHFENMRSSSTKSRKTRAASQKASRSFNSDLHASDSEEDEVVDCDWELPLQKEPRPKRRRNAEAESSGTGGDGYTMNIVKEGDREILELSSD